MIMKITKYRIIFYSCILLSVGLSTCVIILSEKSNGIVSTVLLSIMVLLFIVGTIYFVKIMNAEKK